MLDTREQQQQEIFLKRRKAIKGIEQFTDRFLKLKNLLLDGYINFEDYRLSKEDIETKIQILSDSMMSYRNELLGINDKMNLAVDEFCNPYSIYVTLNNQLKQEFVNNLLICGWQWSEAEFDGIFKQSVHTLYGLRTNNTAEGLMQGADEVDLLLRKLAQMIMRKSIRAEIIANVSNPICST